MAGIDRRTVKPTDVADPLGMYSHVMTVRPGRLAFVAGQVAVDEEGNTVGAGDLPAQTRQVFRNVERVLASVDATFDNVVKFTTYIVAGQSVEEFIAGRTEVFARIFPNGDYPPNTLLFIDRLVHDDLLIETEAIAALP